MLRNVMFGSDPELFLMNAKGFISSVGKIGGTKVHPRPLGDGSAVQEDNVAIEFNTQPAVTREEFIASIKAPLEYLRKFAKENLGGLSLAIVPSAEFPSEELQTMQAQVFGCDPDFNAWTLKVNPRPECAAGEENLRTCGGHLHLSWDNPNETEAVELVRALDLFVGVPSVLYDKDVRRRTLYGKAGAFRYKPYGVEYRTLSNFWIANDKLMGYVYDQAQAAVDFVNKGRQIDKKTETYIAAAINLGRTTHVNALVKQFNIALV
jgi:hypothetical protein